MQRTTIMVPDHILERLRRVAADRRVSMAAVIREALEEKAGTRQPEPKSLGAGDSGYTDTSVLAGEVRAEPRSWR